jgi:rare lipoprotein A (peptidoglycan hydrolase)
MANGQPFDMWDETTVASRYLRIGTRVRLTNIKNGLSREAVVRDRSPISPIDCSYALGAALGFAHLETRSGDTKVRITIIH